MPFNEYSGTPVLRPFFNLLFCRNWSPLRNWSGGTNFCKTPCSTNRLYYDSEILPFFGPKGCCNSEDVSVGTYPIYIGTVLAMKLSPNYRVRSLGIAVCCVLLLLALMKIVISSREKPQFLQKENVFLPVLLSAAIDLAELGGKEVKAVHEQKNLEVKSKGKTKEGAQEFVTDADRRSHEKIVSGLKRVWPNLSVISEERDAVDYSLGEMPDLDRPEVKKFKISSFSGDFVDIRNLTVWVDPLDATQEFTEDLLQYVTVMVCVAYRGDPIMGIVHQPFLDRTYYAWVGKGNFLPTLDTSAASDKLRIIVSRSHAGDVEKVARETLGEDVEVIHAGGAGYKTLQVLGGAADLYLHVTKIKKWDICAPNAFLSAVGGTMTTLEGEGISYGAGGAVNDGGLLASRDREGHTKMLEKFKSLRNT